MKIEEEKTITTTETVLKDVLCNGCGVSIFTNGYTIDGCKVSFDFEYGSAYDGDYHQAHFCDKCYDEIVSKFKLKPTVIHTNSPKSEPDPW